MKRLTLFAMALALFGLVGCTEDETIEEQVYLQDTIELKKAFSGEEGDQDLDKKKKD